MSPFRFLLELRMMEVVVTTGAIRRAKPQSNCQHQQTESQLFTGWMPFLIPNWVKALKGKKFTRSK